MNLVENELFNSIQFTYKLFNFYKALQIFDFLFLLDLVLFGKVFLVCPGVIWILESIDGIMSIIVLKANLTLYWNVWLLNMMIKWDNNTDSWTLNHYDRLIYQIKYQQHHHSACDLLPINLSFIQGCDIY